MDAYEERFAAYEVELRAKYTEKEREEAAAKGHAMDGGGYPIKDQDDLEKAIKAVGRGNADHDAIRKHIIGQAARLKLSKLIPDNWNADGSLADDEQKAAAWDAEHRDGLSYSDMRDLLTSAVAAKFGAGTNCWTYVCDFDDDWLVYEANDGERFRCSYEMDGNAITLGNPEPVRASTTYTPLESKSAHARPRRKERHRAVPLMPEVRFFRADSLEIREESKTNAIVVSGAPIVYGRDYSVTDMFGKFNERMEPGVADDILGGVDTRFLFNHDGLPMARSKNEVGKPPTMTLEDSGAELRFVARLDARQQIANDLWIAIDRGDVTQMSAGFIVARDEWDEAMEHRTIHRLADLLDVSAVTYPASPTTHIQVAQRMAMAMPIESRARLRRLIVDERAGKALSGANQEKVATAIGALHSLYEASGGDPADLLDTNDDTEVVSQDGTQGGGEGDGATAAQDGTLARSETVVDPGEGIRATTKTARVLAMELESRRHRRKAA